MWNVWTVINSFYSGQQVFANRQLWDREANSIFGATFWKATDTTWCTIKCIFLYLRRKSNSRCSLQTVDRVWDEQRAEEGQEDDQENGSKLDEGRVVARLKRWKTSLFITRISDSAKSQSNKKAIGQKLYAILCNALLCNTAEDLIARLYSDKSPYTKRTKGKRRS